MRRATAAGLAFVAILGHARSAFADPCPSNDINSVMREPRVQEEMDDAWRDSQEGTPDEHEEGGNIYHCHASNGDGTERYYTMVLRWPSGDHDSIGSNPPSVIENCTVVADFHTHPGPEHGINPGHDQYTNELPSDADILASGNEGLPGIIRYGHGSDPADTHDFAYGYNDMTEPRDTTWSCRPPRPAWAVGDPHMSTFDSVNYDFQAIGDFVLTRARRGDVEVQVRQQPYRGRNYASINAAVAIRDGRDRMEWYLGEPGPRINGVPNTMAFGASVRLRSYGHLDRRDEGYVFTSSVGDQMLVAIGDEWVDVSVALAAHRHAAVDGLLGNNDGDWSNDIRGSDDVPIAAPDPSPDAAHPLYSTFGRAFRVAAGQSLFTVPYLPPAGVDPTTFPAAWPAFDAAATATAADACRDVADAAGLRDNCIADVAATGNVKFATSSANLAASLEASLMAAPAAGSVLPLNTDVEGTLGPGHAALSFSMNLAPGAYFFDGRTSRYTTWTVTLPDGSEPFDANQRAFMEAYPVRVAVTRGGRATVSVGLQPGESVGRYVFNVHSVPTHEPRLLNVGATASGTIASIGEEVSYALHLARGRYDFVPVEANNTSWSLVSPSGAALFDANQQAFMDDVRGVVVPADGDYKLTVRGRGVVGLGSYRIGVSTAPAAP